MIVVEEGKRFIGTDIKVHGDQRTADFSRQDDYSESLQEADRIEDSYV